MRKAIAAILGLPVLAALYLGPLARRQPVARTALALLAVALLSLAAVNAKTSPATAYLTPTIDPGATVRLSAPLVTDFRARRAVGFDFATPMDEASVAAELTVDPATAVTLHWSSDGRHLDVGPRAAWAPSQLYAIRIAATAQDRAGTALGDQVSATFLTRGRPTATLSIIGAGGSSATPTSGLDIAFSEPVDQDTVRRAFSVTPSVPGRIVSVASGATPTSGLQHFQWLPAEPLEAGAAYTFELGPAVTDADGVSMAAPVVLATSTLGRPAVARVRPTDGQTAVPRDQVISVRFSAAMEHAATQAAFHVSGLDTKAGTFAWYEGDTVVAWTPRSPLAYGTHYRVTLDGSAMSAAGVTMGPTAAAGARSFTFSTVGKPKPVVKVVAAAPTPKPVTRPSVKPTSSAPLYAVELYYLNLLNCTHTGGWVHSDGSCTGRGSNGLAALRLSSGISNCATRPWARYLAVNGLLEHYGGSPYTGPGDRLRACGYTNGTWGENLGQWSGNAYQGAIQVVLFFQGEKATNGGHWRNLMSSSFHSVGIGLWSSGGRVVYNSDFYGG
ncbi:MAG: Ig-like domain-containing protein [Candidatus Limnocylindrales bacterium]